MVKSRLSIKKGSDLVYQTRAKFLYRVHQ